MTIVKQTHSPDHFPYINRSSLEVGIMIALVIGAGNIFRGVAGAAGGMDRSAEHVAFRAMELMPSPSQESFRKMLCEAVRDYNAQRFTTFPL